MIITENQQDKFYSPLVEYYSEIFPFKPEQLAFIEKQLGPVNGKSILDVGSATGELAYQLAENGANVTAIDLSRSLLEKAKTDRSHDRINYMWANMLHISRQFGRSKFDGVVCLGNTLVHLMNPMQMRDFFSGVLTMLKPGGVFVLQILNYDQIFKSKPSALPLIETENIKFERFYQYEEGTREIIFKTALTIKATGETIENQTELLGIGSSDLSLLMDVAGLKDIVLYGGFDGRPFGGEHLPLVVKSNKQL
jgi:glycine/sarcosine N-methyltransferase